MEVGNINKAVHEILSGRTRSDSLEMLDHLLQEYPYFSIARMSYVLSLHQSDDHRKKDELARLALNHPNPHHILNLLGRGMDIEPEVNLTEKVHETPASDAADSPPKSSPEKGTEQQPQRKSGDELEKIIQPSIIEFHVLRDLEDRPVLTDEKREEKKPRIKAAPKSFNEWLEIIDSGAEITEKEEEKTPSASDVVRKFIQTNTTRIEPRKETQASDLAKKSVLDDSGLVTETLAKIYEAQGNRAKAISTYEKLILLNPEKKAYFAARIQSLK